MSNTRSVDRITLVVNEETTDRSPNRLVDPDAFQKASPVEQQRWLDNANQFTTLKEKQTFQFLRTDAQLQTDAQYGI